MPPQAQQETRDFLDPQVLTRLSRLQILPRGPVVGSFAGQHRSPHRGASVEFAEYRRYVPGDDIRHIDWRVYAKTDRFYLKEFEADSNMRCHLLLDCSASMGFKTGNGTRFDLARKMAATLAHLVVLQGDHVGLQCFNDAMVEDIPPRGNPSHLRQVYDTLADAAPSGETRLPEMLHELAEKIRRRAMVVVFSDCFTDVAELLDCFQHMRHRKHDLAVFHLLAREELDFTFDRPIRFVDMESAFALVTDPATVRGAYTDAVYNYLETMRRGCAEFSVDYRLVMTDDNYEEVLSNFMLERMRR